MSQYVRTKLLPLLFFQAFFVACAPTTETCALGDALCQPIMLSLLYHDPSPDYEAEYMFWADGSGLQIRRLDLHSGVETQIVSGKNVTLMHIHGGYLYYSVDTDMNLYRVGLDGTGDGVFFNTGTNGVGGMYFHPGSDRLFYAHASLNQIFSIKTDGTDNTSVRGGFNGPSDLAIVGDLIFVTDQNNNAIQQVSLDGSAQTTIVDSSAGILSPAIMVADPFASKIYWVETPAPSAARRANLDGTNIETLGSSGANNFGGFDLDLYASSFYLNESTLQVIFRDSQVLLSTNVSMGDIELSYREVR